MNKVNTEKRANSKLRFLAKTAILSAAAVLVMLFEVPLPFAPSFYKLDFSESVILMGSFAMGPLAGVIIELLKNLIKALIFGTQTGYIGEFANFLVGTSFVLTASLVYKKRHTKKNALIGMALGTLMLALVGALVNYFILIPAYVKIMGLPLDAIIDAGSAVNASITDLKTLIAFAVVPFNLVKGVICSAIAFLLYKKVSKILHF